jgi:[acyl-carrier-protein] S-malonyltransferase
VLEAEAGVDLGATRLSSPVTRLENIRRLPPPGRFSIADAARLLRMRGRAMQKAVPVGMWAPWPRSSGWNSAMPSDRRRSCGAGVCAAANDNGGGQVVLSGEKRQSSAPSKSPRFAASSGR